MTRNQVREIRGSEEGKMPLKKEASARPWSLSEGAPRRAAGVALEPQQADDAGRIFEELAINCREDRRKLSEPANCW